MLRLSVSTLHSSLLSSTLPLRLLFMPLFHGIRWCAQLKITAKFCKWRWRRRRHLNEMLRTLPGQWRHDSTHSHTHTHIRRQTDAKTDAHSSQRIMMPGRRRCGRGNGRWSSSCRSCTDFCWQWVWKLKASDCSWPRPTVIYMQARGRRLHRTLSWPAAAASGVESSRLGN